MRHQEQSFTLIELLIVIAIIGILAALIIVSLVQANNQAKYQTMRDQLSEISSASNMWFINEGNGADYSPDVGPNQPPSFVPKYLASWPKPPYAGCSYDWNNFDTLKGGGAVWNQHEVDITVDNCNYDWCVYAEPGYACTGGGATIINTQ